MLVWAGGCDSARVAVTPAAKTALSADDVLKTAECAACHGTSNNAAPPKGLKGQTATTDAGVGAHQQHLGYGPAHTPIACQTCHVVPPSKYQTGHLDAADDKATVTFAGLALAGGATPTYDAATATCSNSYCHGATLKKPGKDSKPLWTKVDGSQRSCESCHGAPPAAPHPTDNACETCHAATMGAKMVVTNRAMHINGKVDVVLASNVNCASCHGAPPFTEKHPAVAANCGDCHATTVKGTRDLIAGGTHMNGKVEVALLPAGNSCGGCHGAPPLVAGKDKKPHPQKNQCNDCHASTVDASHTLVAGGTHMDDKVDVKLAVKPTSCDGCHLAPPVVIAATGKPHPAQNQCNDCHASSVTADKAIVAGGTHMDGKVQVQIAAKPSTCDGCHQAPPAVIAATGKPHPQQSQCNDCHAGSVAADKSLIAGGTHMDGKVQVQLAPVPTSCDGCHAAPPKVIAATGKPHPQQAICNDCHAGTVDADKKIVSGGAHLNGKVEVQLAANPSSCSGCHAAPPKVIAATGKPHPTSTVCGDCHAASIKGSKELVSGGKHMDGTIQVVVATAPSSCEGCHAMPPKTTAAGKVHPASDKCSDCHAASIDADKHVVSGGSHYDGKIEFAIGAGTCGQCHQEPPKTVAGGEAHPQTVKDCSKCHATSVDAAKAILAGGNHYNGKVDTAYPNNCYACHGTAVSMGAPAPFTAGNSDPTSPMVGAHAAHLNGKQFSGGGMACEECHQLPKAVDEPGHFAGVSTILFPGGLAKFFGSKPTYDPVKQTCSQTYCHGATQDGAAKPAATWTAPGSVSCGDCHGLPPSILAGHPYVGSSTTKACAACHAKTVNADGTLNLKDGSHINGWVDP
ncbi:MAG: cytochrome c3 family protein [Deltaproteobacteria bacterium]|nr:cytochrome c3 family protein [Deltaproteobacteria bacterium]